MDQSDVIRSFEQSLYTPDELDRAIIRAIREVMIEHDLWEPHMEGTAEEILKPQGALYVPQYDWDDSWEDREAINAFMRVLLCITYDNLSVSLTEDVEQGMTYLYTYVPEVECNCSNPYCSV